MTKERPLAKTATWLLAGTLVLAAACEGSPANGPLCASDAPCDAGNACADGGECDLVVGGLGEPCHGDGTCDGALDCSDDGLCVEPAPRGGEGEPCHDDGTCAEGLTCLDGEVCEAAIRLGPCDRDDVPPGYSIPSGVRCAVVEVPVDHADPAGPTMPLRLAVHPATSATPRTGIFQLAGGPGGSAVAQSGIIPLVMPNLRNEFDLIYLDQRGTGASGYLDCPNQSLVGLSSCAALHDDLPLDHYLTVDAADDLEWVRRRLGYPSIMLRGGSYGTRLGLEYARRYPDRIEAMVLDGLVTPEDDFFTSVILKAQRGIEKLLLDCAADSSCLAIAPNLENDLHVLLEQAQTNPRRINIGTYTEFENEELFQYVLKSFVEDGYWRFRLPRAITHCAAADCSLWDGMMSELFGVTVVENTASLPVHLPVRGDVLAQSSYVSMGLYITVLCAEFAPNIEDISALHALADGVTWGDPESMLGFLDVCTAWALDPIAAELRSPVISDVSTLFLSGAIDFITPPEGGERAVANFANGHHLVIPDATHSVMVTSCGSQIITDYFYANGDIDAVDISCLETYKKEFQ